VHRLVLHARLIRRRAGLLSCPAGTKASVPAGGRWVPSPPAWRPNRPDRCPAARTIGEWLGLRDQAHSTVAGPLWPRHSTARNRIVVARTGRAVKHRGYVDSVAIQPTC
jgi:hypothetical protein